MMKFNFAIAFLVICVFCFQTNAQRSENIEFGSESSFENDTNAEISRILLKKDVTEYANELSKTKPKTFEELMRRIYVFERAGQTKRARQTARLMFDVGGYENHYHLAMEIFVRHLDEKDVDGFRVYVKNYLENQDVFVSTELFIKRWENVADVDEIEKWLLERYDKLQDERKTSALNDLYEWRVKHGGAETICETLRNNFTDGSASIEKSYNYLRFCHDVQSVNWLAENFVSTHAYDYYKLGKTIQELPRHYAYKNRRKDYEELWRISIMLYQNSLNINYSDYDKTAMDSREFSNNSPERGIRGLYSVANENYEKQLRYWTKNQIVSAYRDLKQPELAQPLLQELAETDKDNILANFEIYDEKTPQPSAVNIESQILRDEATKREDVDYWTKRINYYRGTKNVFAVEQSFNLAFGVFISKECEELPCKEWLVNKRLKILWLLANYGYTACEEESQGCDYVKQFFKRELSTASSNLSYLNDLLLLPRGRSLESLQKQWAIENPNILIELVKQKGLPFAANNVFHQIAESNLMTDAQKQNLWNQLETATSNSDASLASFAHLMSSIGENERAIRSYKETIRRSPEYEAEYVKRLFYTLLKTGDWRTAQKLRFKNMKFDWEENYRQFDDELSYQLEQIALVAVQQNAIKDALRLWKIRANLDRREIDLLPELAKTKLKEPLREFYLQMKIRDPLSTAPDAALEQLK